MKIIRIMLLTVLLIGTSSFVWAGAEEIAALPEIAPDAIRVFVIRHAETYHQVQKLDPSSERYYAITPRGEKRSQAAGYALRKQPIAACYTSVTERTKRTLQLTQLASLNGVQAIAEKAFNRPAAGILENGSSSTFSWRIQQWNQGRDPQPQGGESLSQATRRGYTFMRQIQHAYGKAIVIVSHGDIIASLVGAADGVPVWQRWEKFNAETGSISVVDIYKNGPAVLRAFNIKVWEDQ